MRVQEPPQGAKEKSEFIIEKLLEECQSWPDGPKSEEQQLKFLLNLVKKYSIFPMTREHNTDYITQLTLRKKGEFIFAPMPTSGYVFLEDRRRKSLIKVLQEKGFNQIPIEMMYTLYIELKKINNPAYMAYKKAEKLMQTAKERAVDLLPEFRKLSPEEQRQWLDAQMYKMAFIYKTMQMNVEEFKKLTKEQQKVWIEAYEHQVKLTRESMLADIQSLKNMSKQASETVEEVSRKILGPKLPSLTRRNYNCNISKGLLSAALLSLFLTINGLDGFKSPQVINGEPGAIVSTYKPDEQPPKLEIRRGEIPFGTIGMDRNTEKKDIRSREQEEIEKQAEAEAFLAEFLKKKEEEEKQLQQTVDQMVKELCSDRNMLSEFLAENEDNSMKSMFVNLDDYTSAAAKIEKIKNQENPGCIFIRVKNNVLKYEPSTIARLCCENGLNFQFVLLSTSTDEAEAEAEANMLNAEIDKITEAGYENNFLGTTIFVMYDAIHPERDPQQAGKDYTQVKEKLLEFINHNIPMYLFSLSVYNLDRGYNPDSEKGIVNLAKLAQSKFLDGAIVLEDNGDPEFERLCLENDLPIVGKFYRDWKNIELNPGIIDYSNKKSTGFTKEEIEFLRFVIESELRPTMNEQQQEEINDNAVINPLRNSNNAR